MSKEQSAIGVIGGVGPHAGLDFVRKIFTNTRAVKDQEHINCMLISCPSLIPDRTGYILKNENEEAENPAVGMLESAGYLYAAGVRYASVACNTAHSEIIFSHFMELVKEKFPGFNIINMLESSAVYVKKTYPDIKRIGLLATKGTYKSRVYHEYFKKEDGFEIIEPEERGQERIHEAIYSETYGIKANSIDISPQARDWISYEIYRLMDRDAEAVILGCTELPLVVSPQNYAIPVIDPGLITARRLIQLTNPHKLLD